MKQVENMIEHIENRKLSQNDNAEIEEKRLEAAKKAIGQIPNIGAVTPKTLQTPEDFEEVAKILKKKAQKEREAKLTPAEKQKIAEEKKKKQVEYTQKSREKTEKLKSEVKEEAKREAREELLQDPDVIREIQSKQLQTTIEEPDNSGIPSSEEQLKNLFDAISKIPPPKENPTKRKEQNAQIVRHIELLIARNDVRCPKCGKRYELSCGCK